MEIILEPEMQAKAEQKVASGEYASFSELVITALRPLLDAPSIIDEDTGLPLEKLKQMIAHSHAQMERGEYTEVSREGLKDFFESIKKEGRERLEAEQAVKK